MKRKTLTTSALGAVFALTAFTPLVTHAFTNGKSGATQVQLAMVDKPDNQISNAELTTHVKKMVDRMDTNGSFDVSGSEWLFAGHMSDQH